MFRKAIENTFGVARPPREPGRPPKPVAAKYKSVSIRLHPKVLDWAKREAKKRGVGYQTFLNEYLLRKSA